MPSVVTDALSRIGALVERDPQGWTVGGVRCGTSAEALTEGLYAHWYTQPAVPPPSGDGDPPLQRSSLLSAFRAAHAGSTTTTPGWTVTATNPRGALSAARDGSALVLQPGTYTMGLRPGAPPVPGEPVEPLARRDHLDAERGIWWSFGERPPEPPSGRLYLDVRPATAARAIHEVTAALEPAAYQLKCPVLAEACERVDAVVIYHQRAARDELLAALLERWQALGPMLDPAVPPLTCPVRPGLAWADDVEEQRSYGDSRCRTLAVAIDAAAASWQASDPEPRLELLLAALQGAGIDPERPWQATR